MTQSGTSRPRPRRARKAPVLEPTAPTEAVASTEPGPAPAPPPQREPALPGSGRRRPVVLGVAVVLAVLAGILLARLGAQERGGPAHIDLSIGDGIPATLYVPGETDDGDFPFQPPPSERPPLVVIAHGYSADRMIMSSMARSLARAGYAALTFDFRGHGSNTKAFQGDLRQDLDAVLDWAVTSPNVDGSRVAVLGHSMGAGAALDFASIDSRPLAVIPVSGGYAVNDAHVPPNVLFLVASGDPGDIHDRQEDLAGELEGRSNVRSVEVGGTDHVTILWSGRTVDEIVAFLDPVLDVQREDGTRTGLQDPRLGTAVLYLLVAIALIGMLGLAVGRFVEPLPSTATAGAFVLLAGGLVVTMPLLSTGGYGILPIGAGQPVVVHLALAGGLLWATRLAAQRGVIAGRAVAWIGDGPWLPLRSVALPGAAAAVAVFALLAPIGVVFHRLVPTTERLVLWILVAALALPFFAAFETFVRRGSTWRAVGLGVLGRLLLLMSLAVGVGLGVLPGVIALVMPLLVLQYVVLEVFAATCYATGRNPAVIAVVDSIFIAWFATTLTPIG
jgi:dienelactone hydrolase